MAIAHPGAPASARTADREVTRAQIDAAEQGSVVINRAALLHASFAYFMASLVDDAGRPLRVDEHNEEWAELFQHEPLLCLLAPRDHGKTWEDIAYLLWRCWRHNRDPITGELYEGMPEGRFLAVLFSETLPQAETFFEVFQTLLLANAELFADLIPHARRATGEVWSKRRVRLRNGASVTIRGYRTSTRGLHPDLIILDDVLNDQNTLTQYQRDKVWRYFVGTLIPMAASQYIIIGTAFHLDDLLHRLRPRPKNPVILTIGRRRARFRWVKYRSINWETGQVLWPWKYDYDGLKGRRDLDALLFAREMQNDPIDDSSSLFPFALTNRSRREHLTFLPRYTRDVGDFLIGGMDVALSASIGADYTVLYVAVWNRHTGRVRPVFAHRERGMEFDDQVDLLRTVCRTYGIDLLVVESNTFQRWLHQRINKYPETAGRVQGHRTGEEKADLADGVPSMRLALEVEPDGLVDWPTGDEDSLEAFTIWQAEMAAYGWKDGKLMGIGEHDDTVMGWYMLDRARRLIEEWLFKAEQEGDELVTAEEFGIAPVRIGKEY